MVAFSDTTIPSLDVFIIAGVNSSVKWLGRSDFSEKAGGTINILK